MIRGFGSRPSKQALHISSASRLYRRGAHTKEIERPWADANSTAERNSFHRPAFGSREKGENVNRRAVRTQEITWEESPFKTKLCLPVASAIAIAVFTANVAALISHWFPEADSHRKAEEKGHNTEQHTHENTPLSLGRSARNPPSKLRLVIVAGASAAALHSATRALARCPVRCLAVRRSGGGRSSSLSSSTYVSRR